MREGLSESKRPTPNELLFTIHLSLGMKGATVTEGSPAVAGKFEIRMTKSEAMMRIEPLFAFNPRA